MEKNTLNFSQGVACLSLLLMGNSLVTGGDRSAGYDTWLVILAVTGVSLLLGLMYVRIVNLYPGRGLFQILAHLFGPVAGRAFGLLFAVYFLHLSALTLADFTAYVSIVSLPTTPSLWVTFSLLLLCFSLAVKGVQVLGRVALLLLILTVCYFLGNLLLSYRYFQSEHILPMLRRPPAAIAQGAFYLLALPFSDTAAFLALLPFVRRGASKGKLFALGLAIGGVIFAYTALRNALMLGESLFISNYFPSFLAASLIILGDYLQHIEMLVSIAMLFCVFIKTSVALVGVRLGLEALLPKAQPRWLLLLLAVGAAVGAHLLLPSPQALYAFRKTIYPFYALPFQVGLPFLFWVVAEIKSRKEKRLVAGA